jgi:hypothetical protein
MANVPDFKKQRRGWVDFEEDEVEQGDKPKPRLPKKAICDPYVLPVAPPPPPKELDGYERGFLDAEVMVKAVREAFPTRPAADDTQILKVALADVSLNERSAKQVWLTLGYWFKEKLNCVSKFSESAPPQAIWIQTALCFYANSRKIDIPTPDVFTFLDDIKFRS